MISIQFFLKNQLIWTHVKSILKNVDFLHVDFLKAFMVSQILTQMRQKIYLVPRVFSQKGNGVTIFGHR
jgi:hypothetical protein